MTEHLASSTEKKKKKKKRMNSIGDRHSTNKIFKMKKTLKQKEKRKETKTDVTN